MCMKLVSATKKHLGDSPRAPSSSETYKLLPIPVRVPEARVHKINEYSLVRYLICLDKRCTFMVYRVTLTTTSDMCGVILPLLKNAYRSSAPSLPLQVRIT